jgi:hypothetical protein
VENIRRIKTLDDLNDWALELAEKLPSPMNSSQSHSLSQDQLDQLMNDPQLVELGGKWWIAKMFHYIATLTHAGNDTQNTTIQIDSDADFQMLMIMGTNTSPNVTLEVTEGGAGGLAWQSAPVNFNLFCGTAQNPFPAGLIPQLLPKKRVYSLRSVNTSGAANALQIDFWGYKLFDAGQAAQVGALPSQN